MEFEDMLVGDVVVVILHGKIMAYEDSLPLRDRIKEHLDSEKTKFVIDMADVPWMNSEGIGLLATAVATVGKGGGRLVLANISKKVESVLIITKCNSIIRHYDSREAAVASFSDQPSTPTS